MESLVNTGLLLLVGYVGMQMMFATTVPSSSSSSSSSSVVTITSDNTTEFNALIHKRLQPYSYNNTYTYFLDQSVPTNPVWIRMDNNLLPTWEKYNKRTPLKSSIVSKSKSKSQPRTPKTVRFHLPGDRPLLG